MTLPVGPRPSHPTFCVTSLRRSACTTRTRGDLLGSRRLLQRRSNVQALPPLITAMAGRPTRLDVGASDMHKARLSLEGGGTRDIAVSPIRGRLRVPAISETGYHRLLIEDREFVLAVAPTRCRTIDDAVPDARLWGIAAQVYSLRHCGDGGIGDATGIAALAEAAGSRGADALALSPLHALFGADPSRFGPYSPSTRLFLNPLHASPALVFGEAHVADTLRAEGLSETFERLEALSLIDWPAAARAKHRLLRALFEPFIDAPGAYGDSIWTLPAFAPMAANCWRSTWCSKRCMPRKPRPISAIGIIGRLICAIQTVLRSRYSRRRTSARYCSTASCNGLPIDHSAWRRAAL